jgi:hypothetical protein
MEKKENRDYIHFIWNIKNIKHRSLLHDKKISFYFLVQQRMRMILKMTYMLFLLPNLKLRFIKYMNKLLMC